MTVKLDKAIYNDDVDTLKGLIEDGQVDVNYIMMVT